MVGVTAEPVVFERMFRAHHVAVYRYVARRVEAAAVQDVVAETFLTAWRRFDELAGEPLPWLLGIARRVSANHLRGRARRVALREKLETEPQAEHAEAVVDGALLSALMTLRDGEREVLLLVAWDGLTNREAAIVVGCSASAFAVRLYRARRRLAQVLSSQPADGSTPAGGREGVVVHDVT
jgi:RNA polymerase sigma-70 factor (ECF subfamily)